MKKIRNSINSKVKTYNYALKTLVINLLSLVLFWAFRLSPSGFPLYLFPLCSKRMPLQSLTHPELKTESGKLILIFSFQLSVFNLKVT